MKREIRKLVARGGTSAGLAKYIYKLQARGLIGKYKSAAGAICYDTAELSAYRKKAQVGRPTTGNAKTAHWSAKITPPKNGARAVIYLQEMDMIFFVTYDAELNIWRDEHAVFPFDCPTKILLIPKI